MPSCEGTRWPASWPTRPAAGPSSIELTSPDLVYVRLHGDKELYASGYSPGALDTWAERCHGWADEGRDVVVYFDNDIKGFAPHDALALIERLP